jgi:hypothetical protein
MASGSTVRRRARGLRAQGGRQKAEQDRLGCRTGGTLNVSSGEGGGGVRIQELRGSVARPSFSTVRNAQRSTFNAQRSAGWGLAPCLGVSVVYTLGRHGGDVPPGSMFFAGRRRGATRAELTRTRGRALRRPDVNYVLNRKRATSPSWNTYSLPSSRYFPASRAAATLPRRVRSS